MSSIPYHIELSVEVRTPFLTQSSEPGVFGQDAVIARDKDGKPIIPGSLLAGKLLDAWEQFDETDLITRWLGVPGHNFEPSPGKLCDTDLRMDGPSCLDAIRAPYSRVRIDEITEANVPGSLLFIEQPWAAGAIIRFKGTWHAIGGEQEIQVLCRAIEGGLKWMAQLGSERSIGFGQVRHIEAKYQAAPAASNRLTDSAGSRILVSLKYTEPLCLPEKASGNLFSSSNAIPGNALKAAFALTWGAQEENGWNKPVTSEFSKEHQILAENFSQIRFSHAFPAGNDQNPGDTRPLPLPQSLVVANKQFYDVAFLDKPHLIQQEAPEFQIDWKIENFQNVQKFQQWGETTQALRVRTAIEKGRRISKEEALFAYETVSATKNTRWLGWIDFSCIEDTAQRKQAMQSFLSLTQRGLHYVGKTKVVGTIEVMSQQSHTWPSSTDCKNNVWIVMLNTPTLMTPISCLSETSGKDDLREAYADFWRNISKGSLELSHYFAYQRLAGGKYAYQRRQRGNGRKAPYRPWLLTEAGSVFVLRKANEEAENNAKACIQQWMQSGLPLSEAVIAEYTDEWKHNPYLPQNGYGEISVNIQHDFNQLLPNDCRLTLVEEPRA